jgi:hypothetical protein
MPGAAVHVQVEIQEMGQEVVRWRGMCGQEIRWQGKGEDRPGDRSRRHLRLAGGGCWFVLPVHGECGLFGSIR